jgi:hypothetical protein
MVADFSQSQCSPVYSKQVQELASLNKAVAKRLKEGGEVSHLPTTF